MPISYAVGYAMSQDFEQSTMRELFRYADKNMYIDKNRAKMEEAAEEKRMNQRLLAKVKEMGYQLSLIHIYNDKNRLVKYILINTFWFCEIKSCL